MAEELGSSKELGNENKQFSEAQAGIKALNLSDSQQHLQKILRQNSSSTSETSMHDDEEGDSDKGKGKSRVCVVHGESSSSPPPPPPSSSSSSSTISMSFKEHQLKQLRAQCIVYRAFSNGVQPKEKYLEIALGTKFSGGEGD